MKRLWIVALFGAALVASAASAAPTPLQIHKITAHRQDDYLRMKIFLNRPWTGGILRKGSGTTLSLLYETTGDNKTDYVGRFTFHDGELFEQISGEGSTFPEVPVNRPTKTEAIFTHPSDVLFPDPADPGTMKLILVFKQPGFKVDRLPPQGLVADPQAAVAVRLRTILLGAVAGVLLVASTAGAAGQLRVTHLGWVTKPGLVTLQIDLAPAWKNSAFAPASTNALWVLYDSNADGKVDYTGRIVTRGTKLVEEISGHGNRYEPVPVSRPTATAAKFTHPFDPVYTGVTHRKTLRVAIRLRSGGQVKRYPAVKWVTVPAPR